MEPSQSLLNFVYQNAQMGVTTIDQLRGIVQDQAFMTQLDSQQAEYQSLLNEARKQLSAQGMGERGLSQLEKLRTYWMISVQTLIDKSPSHISEMLIIGSNMGVLDAYKQLKRLTKADDASRELMRRLLQSEEQNIQQLKAFL